MIYSPLLSPFDRMLKKKTNAENAFFLCSNESCNRNEMIGIRIHKLLQEHSLLSGVSLNLRNT